VRHLINMKYLRSTAVAFALLVVSVVVATVVAEVALRLTGGERRAELGRLACSVRSDPWMAAQNRL
jgi:hypothetical protein